MITIRGMEKISTGLIRVAVSGTVSRPISLWTRAKARKPHNCVRCGGSIPVGAQAYRTIENADYRMYRMCEPCVEGAVG